MSEKQAEHLSDIKYILEENSQSNSLADNSLVEDVFDDLQRIFRRFRPTKMVSLFNNQVEASELNKEMLSNIDNMTSVIEDLSDNLGEVESEEQMVDQLEQLQSLLDFSSEKLEGKIEVEGFEEENVRKVIKDMMEGIDNLSDRANQFYQEVINEQFSEEFADNFEEFKEETLEWFGDADEKFEEIFDQEDGLKEFEQDRKTQWRKMKNEVKDVSGEVKEEFSGMFEGINAADMAELASLGGIRQQIGAEEEVYSLIEARDEFRTTLGATREEWGDFLGDQTKWFRELNEEAGYTIQYSDDFVQTLQEVAETDIADVDTIEQLTRIGTEYRTMLEGFDVEQWRFMRKVVNEFGEDGSDSIKEVMDHIGYLDNELELHFSAETGLGVIEDMSVQLRNVTDSAEGFRDLASSVAEATAVMQHMQIEEPTNLMEDFRTLLSGEELQDEDLMTRMTAIIGDVDVIKDRLEEGDFVGVVRDYMEGLEKEFGDIEDSRVRSAIAEQFGMDPKELQEVLNNMDRMDEAVNKLGGSFEESADYVEKYNKESNPESWAGRLRQFLMTREVVSDLVVAWQELGVSAEFAGIALFGLYKGIGAVYKGLVGQEVIPAVSQLVFNLNNLKTVLMGLKTATFWGAIVAGLYLFMTNYEQIRDKIGEGLVGKEGWKNFDKESDEWREMINQDWLKPVQNFRDKIYGYSPIHWFVQNMKEDMGEVDFGQIWDNLKESHEESGVLGMLGDYYFGIFEGIVDTAKGAWSGFTEYIDEEFEYYGVLWEDFSDNAKNNLSSVGDFGVRVWNHLRSAYDLLVRTPLNFREGINQAIDEYLQEIQDKRDEIYDSIMDWFPSFEDILDEIPSLKELKEKVMGGEERDKEDVPTGYERYIPDKNEDLDDMEKQDMSSPKSYGGIKENMPDGRGKEDKFDVEKILESRKIERLNIEEDINIQQDKEIQESTEREEEKEAGGMGAGSFKPFIRKHEGGYVGGREGEEVPALLEAGEYVVPRDIVSSGFDNILSYIIKDRGIVGEIESDILSSISLNNIRRMSQKNKSEPKTGEFIEDYFGGQKDNLMSSIDAFKGFDLDREEPETDKFIKDYFGESGIDLLGKIDAFEGLDLDTASILEPEVGEFVDDYFGEQKDNLMGSIDAFEGLDLDTASILEPEVGEFIKDYFGESGIDLMDSVDMFGDEKLIKGQIDRIMDIPVGEYILYPDVDKFLNVRELYGLEEKKIGSVYPKDRLALKNKFQVEKDGYKWWNVGTEEGLEGWVASEFLEKIPEGLDEIDNIYKRLLIHEGFESEQYQLKGEDYPTIGIGTHMQGWDEYLEEVTLDEAVELMVEDVDKVRNQVKDKFDWYGDLSDVRKDVIDELVYNMGLGNFTDFEDTIDAIKREDWEEVQKELKDSEWYRKDVQRDRSNRLIEMMGENEYSELDTSVMERKLGEERNTEDFVDAFQNIGGYQYGGIVDGIGAGDIIPAMLEPGEAIVPKNIVKDGIGSVVDWFKSVGIGDKEAEIKRESGTARTSVGAEGNEGIESVDDTIVEVVNDNDDVVEVLEWQTKKVVNAIKELNKNKNQNKSNPFRERKDRDSLAGFE